MKKYKCEIQKYAIKRPHRWYLKRFLFSGFSLAILLSVNLVSPSAIAETPISTSTRTLIEGFEGCFSADFMSSLFLNTQLIQENGGDSFGHFDLLFESFDATTLLRIFVDSNTFDVQTDFSSQNPSISFQGTVPLQFSLWGNFQTGEIVPLEGSLTVQGQIQSLGTPLTETERENIVDPDIRLPIIGIDILRETETNIFWEEAEMSGVGSLALSNPENEALLPPELLGEFQLGFLGDCHGSLSHDVLEESLLDIVKQAMGLENDSCGDGFCQTVIGEAPFNCPDDCGYCGNGSCEHRFEDAISCSFDCSH